ncbi:hypothetical protein DFH07DRAFT_944684 [Mycena maculata]|uniref:Uncharacterized protein n=1 Tax=Mycena maculata TaxID=230809 RepID=A0AAD7I3Y6_9AGAR|nr:hypothetical protein DFH07DRAFT_944684 [Mycena maculata]
MDPDGYRKGCGVIRRKLVETNKLRWSPTQIGTHPGRDPSDRKRSGRRAWEPGLICDSAGDLEDARKGTEEAPDEVKGIWLRMRMTGGKNNKDKQDPEVSGRLRNEDEIEGRLSP